jgi:general secretion pathway protein E/type IV pilus assembly protein PilB
MIDMGVEPFLVASTVEGIMAQRLVRTICPDCKTKYTPAADDVPLDFPTRTPPGAAEEMVSDDAAALQLYTGSGCRSCRQSGYRGRTGIHELLVTGDRIKDLIVQRVNAGVIRNEALKAGMRTLRQDGWLKVLDGTTTLDEVGRVTAGDIS